MELPKTKRNWNALLGYIVLEADNGLFILIISNKKQYRGAQQNFSA